MNGENTDSVKNRPTVTLSTGEEVSIDTSNIDLTQKISIKPGMVDAPELFDAFIAGYNTSLQVEEEDSEEKFTDDELRERLENDFTQWVEKHVSESN